MNLHPTQQRIMELVMQYSSAIQTVEMHTAGEPVRIVLVSEEILSKMPPSTTGILAQRDWFKREADWLRVQTLREPRGHADMYGVWLLGWVDDQADPEASVLFTHNEGL